MSTDQHPARGTVAQALTLRLALCLILIAIVCGTVECYVSVLPLEQDLEIDAAAICHTLIQDLQSDVWNLDTRAIRTYFEKHRQRDDLVAVRILTQYGDPLFVRTFGADRDVLVRRELVRHQKELVGTVEVTMSKARVRGGRAEIIVNTIVRTTITVAAAILLSAVFMKVFVSRPLWELARGLRRLAEGHYDERLPAGRHRDLAEINREANTMAAQIAERTTALEREVAEHTRTEQALEAYRDHLEELVQKRTATLSKLNAGLHREVERRKRAQAETLAIRDREQTRIGQDLHDTLGSELTGAHLFCTALEKELAAATLPMAAKAARVAELLERTISQVRLIARGLNAVDLGGHGLAEALEQLANDIEVLSGVTCVFQCDAARCVIHDEAVASHLYQVARESLHNAIRHGAAQEIQIELTVSDGDGTLIVRDDGKGFPEEVADQADGIGIRTMRYRAEAMNGRLAIQSRPGAGTTVTCTFRNRRPGIHEPGEGKSVLSAFPELSSED